MAERFDSAREVLPEFGRMLHLPHKPNCDRDDLVATEDEASIIFRTGAWMGISKRTLERLQPSVLVEEKLDGSQVGVASAGDGEVPIIRNKNHILVKGYGRKNTNAKRQYAPLWNWVYEHANEFAALTALCGELVGVYGEWLYAEHTLRYDLAPADFVAYQIYQPSLGAFVDAYRTRELLGAAGFAQPDLLATRVDSYAQLEALTQEPSRWSSRDLREGIVVKVSDGERLVVQFKMRRGDFKPREDFNDSAMIRRGHGRHRG